MANLFSTFAKFSIPGLLDEVAPRVLGGGIGMITGFGKGIIGKPLNMTNAPLGKKVLGGLGYGVGKAGVSVAKPLIKATAGTGAAVVKSIGPSATAARKLGRTVRDIGFKKTTGKSNPLTSFMGYESRALTPWALTIGALGLGAAQAAGSYDYNLGLKTLTNGMMDTEGVAVTPGSVNASYTPLYQKGKPVKDFGATGEIPLALNKRRRG